MLNPGLLQEEDFYSLKEEWNTLLQESEANTITLTWEWLYTWWQVFRDKSRKLIIVAVREGDGRLVGIAPLLLREVRPYPCYPKIKQLEFLGSGEDEADEVCSDYLNFIVQRGREKEVLSKMLGYLTRELVDEWDEILLTDILGDCETTTLFEGILADYSLRSKRMPKGPCFYVNLPKTWEGFLMGLGREMRYKIRRDRRVLSKHGKVTYHAVAKEDDLEEGLKTLVALHQKRWSEKGKPGVFSSKKFLLFHKTLMPLALSKNWLKLSFLLLDQKPIAAIYNFKFHNKMFFYQSGIDTDIEPNLSPGLLLHSYCIEEAIGEGFREYDFLMGASEYKQRWAKQSRDLISIRITSNNASVPGIHTARKAMSLLKRFRRSASHITRQINGQLL